MKKLSISLVLVVVFAVVVLGWLITELNYRFNGNATESDAVVSAYQALGLSLAKTLDKTEDREFFVQQWQIDTGADQDGIQLTVQNREDYPVPSSLEEGFENGDALILGSESLISFHYLMPLSGQVLSMSVPEGLFMPTENKLSLFFTLIFYLGVAAAVIVWLYPLVRRLSVLGRAARAIGLGELSSRVPLGKYSYISHIEAEFNRMADRIQSLIRDNRLLSKAVSHNLKTPLARLRFGIDVLEETEDADQRAAYTARINRDLAEMESLVDTLLQFAKLDESDIQLNLTRINLLSLIPLLLEDAGSDGTADKTSQFVCTEKAMWLETDKSYLIIVLNNLLDNAFNHANQKVLISVVLEKNKICLCIEDDGPGIPAEERALVLEPFCQGSNGNPSKGHGMGLAIVARITDWLHADLSISQSGELGGAKISLHFLVNYR